MAAKTISAEEFDRRFDDGEDISEYLDLGSAFRPADFANTGLSSQLLHRLAAEASRRGTTMQMLIAQWLEERLDKAA